MFVDLRRYMNPHDETREENSELGNNVCEHKRRRKCVRKEK